MLFSNQFSQLSVFLYHRQAIVAILLYFVVSSLSQIQVQSTMTWFPRKEIHLLQMGRRNCMKSYNSKG